MAASGWHRKQLNTPAEQARKARYNTPEHRAARKQYAAEVAAGRGVCWRCGKPIPAGTDFHVGHNDAGSQIMGAEHARGCNLKAAASKGARTTNAHRLGRDPMQGRPSRLTW